MIYWHAINILSFLSLKPQGHFKVEVTMATTEAERMTFLDKKKFFEKEIKDHVTGKKHVQGVCACACMCVHVLEPNDQ